MISPAQESNNQPNDYTQMLFNIHPAWLPGNNNKNIYMNQKVTILIHYTKKNWQTSEPGSIDVSDASEEEMAQEPLVVHIALSLASDLDQKDVEIKRRKPEVKKNSGVSVAFALPNGHRHRSQSSQEETTILSKKERISTSSTRSAPVSAKTALSYDSIADKFREMERDKKVDNSKSQSICTTFSSKRRKDLT